MKLALICLFIQAILLYRRVGCGIEQAASLLGQASNLLNAGGAANTGGLASGLLNAGGFSNAAGLMNAAGGLSNVGNFMSGGGILNMVQNSYLTPAPIKAGNSCLLLLISYEILSIFFPVYFRCNFNNFLAIVGGKA